MVCETDTNAQNCATENYGMAEVGRQAIRWFRQSNRHPVPGEFRFGRVIALILPERFGLTKSDMAETGPGNHLPIG